MSPATAAGKPPMSTLLTPGPTTVPPWMLMSVTRAAGGIGFSSVDLDEAALDLGHPGAGHHRGAPAAQGRLRLALGAERRSGLERQAGAGLDRDRLVARERDPVGIQLDRVAALIDDPHRPVLITQRDPVAGRSLQPHDLLVVVEVQLHRGPALIHLLMVVVRAGQRRRLGAAVAHAEHYRPPRIIVEKPHHHLVAELRPEEEAAVGAGVDSGHTGPDAIVGRRHEREADAHAVLAIRILVAGDDADL